MEAGRVVVDNNPTRTYLSRVLTPPPADLRPASLTTMRHLKLPSDRTQAAERRRPKRRSGLITYIAVGAFLLSKASSITKPANEHTTPRHESEPDGIELKERSLEHEKLSLERDKLAVSLYVEDFKARWQELLNFENENNRWITLYVTALLLVISWILNNGEKYKGLRGLYAEGDNAYFIMSIAFINALYTFSMAFKGYQIQQIAQYQYEFIAGKIWDLSHVPFNDWERYRREVFAKKRGAEPIRKMYYVLIGSLPTFVSYVIIFLYWYYEWRRQAGLHHWASVRNWFSLGVVAVMTCSLIFSWLTSRLNSRWEEILSKAESRR
jgi:hypothetical protein